MTALAPTPFEVWAPSHGYNITPAVLPAENRVFADSRTQDAFEAYIAGAASVARMFTESTLDTEAFREKILELAESA